MDANSRWAAFLAVGTASLLIAWISEDALITMRTVHNCLAGDGLRWNVSDRVLTNTHPLWMLMLVVANWLIPSCYHAAIVLCLACTLGTAAVLVWGLARSAGTAALAALACILSRAWLDYSSSGLENAFGYLLAAGFVARWIALPSRRRDLALAAIAGCAILNRLDHSLLYVPAMLVVLAAARPQGNGHRLRVVMLMVAPVGAWLAFALVYYGDFLPIVYYGKLGGAVGHGYLLARAAEYFAYTLCHDPLTFAVLLAGVVVAARSPTWRPFALGLAAYLGYLGYAGGCYMAGRLLAVPFALAIAVLVAQAPTRRTLQFATGAVLILGLLSGWPRPMIVVLDLDDDSELTAPSIEDQCARFWRYSGLWSRHRNDLRPDLLPPPPGVDDDHGQPLIRVHQAVGMIGLVGGPRIHIVDPVLTDPVLMFLPNWGAEPIRRSHYLRRIPRGYLLTLATGENHITHPGLAAFVASRLSIVRAPLFDGDRWREIWRQFRGDYRAGLADYVATEYADLVPETVDAAAVATPLPNGRRWTRGDVHILDGLGLKVRFDTRKECARLGLSLDCCDRYSIQFLLADAAAGQVERTIEWPEWSGLRNLEIEVPEPARTHGFDALMIRPLMPTLDFLWALGHIECRQ